MGEIINHVCLYFTQFEGILFNNKMCFDAQNNQYLKYGSMQNVLHFFLFFFASASLEV